MWGHSRLAVVLISLHGRLQWTFCCTADKQREEMIHLSKKTKPMSHHGMTWGFAVPSEASAEGEIGLHPAGKLRFAEWQISRMMHLWDEID